MKPYKATPTLKERIWGGHRLKQYGKSFEAANIGESWETDMDSMPVLIKLIDAREVLSVQVHPDNEAAWRLEKQKQGKSEAWIVLDCDDDAELVMGFKEGADRSTLELALKDGSIRQYLNNIRVKRGDCLYIPAGTVHSLGGGIIVYEVQQPSDITYRLYDWERTDLMGMPRQLHIEKALSCISFDPYPLKITNLYEQNLQPLQKHTIFKNDYFKTSYISIPNKRRLSLQSSSFAAVTAISGTSLIKAKDSEELMKRGDTWIIEHGGEISMQALENVELIVTERSAINR